MRAVDLHTHSTASDGSMSPSELVSCAKQKGLAAIALTDHDTIGGLEEAVAAGGRRGVEVVCGIETTLVVDGCDVHLVCLLFDPAHPAMAERMAGLAASRDERNRAMVGQLCRAGLHVSRSDLQRWEGRSIAKAHIAELLIERGYAADIRESIDRYMSKGTPGYVERRTPDPREFIRAVHQAGGVACIGHINQIDRGDWKHGEQICRLVIAAGVDGLETLYCEYDGIWRARADALRREFNLLSSGGSDFHGSFKPGLELGTGYGGLFVPESFLLEMKRYRAERVLGN